MCTILPAERNALVCDVALPLVRLALAADPELAVTYETKPGEGTEVNLQDGNLAQFQARLRAAVAESGQ